MCRRRSSAEALDWALVPFALIAATRNAYAVPLVSAGTICVVAVEEKVTGVWATPEMYGVTV